MKVHYSSQFQWPHWEWLKSNFERSSSRSSFRRTFQNKIGLFLGVRKASSKKLSTEREDGARASSTYSEYTFMRE